MAPSVAGEATAVTRGPAPTARITRAQPCLLYTSDAADERSSVDLGGRRIIKKKNTLHDLTDECTNSQNNNTPQTSTSEQLTTK